MARTAARTAELESHLWAGVGYLSKKRTVRDHLTPGETRVAGVIAGTVGRSVVELPFCGRLIVGDDQAAASSSAPDTSHVVAILLDRLGDGDRDRLLATLPREFEAAGELPDVPAERIDQAAELLKRLRSSTMTARRGNVVFESE
jgi:hypothetical protein